MESIKEKKPVRGKKRRSKTGVVPVIRQSCGKRKKRGCASVEEYVLPFC